MSQTPSLRYPGAYAATLGAKPAVIVAESGATRVMPSSTRTRTGLRVCYRWLGFKAGDHVAYFR